MHGDRRRNGHCWGTRSQHVKNELIRSWTSIIVMERIFLFSMYNVSYHILYSMYDIIVSVINVRLIFKDNMVIECINHCYATRYLIPMIRIRVGHRFSWVRGSWSGSRQDKMVGKKIILWKISFWRALCRASGPWKLSTGAWTSLYEGYRRMSERPFMEVTEEMWFIKIFFFIFVIISDIGLDTDPV